MVDFLGAVGGGATVAITIKAIDQFSDTFNKASSGLEKFAKVGTASLLGAATAITAVTVAGSKLAVSAAQAGDIQDNFNKVLGDNGVVALQAFQKETLGTIDKFTAMKTISAAVNKGIASENIPILARYAQQLNDAGIAQGSVTDTLNAMSTAVATGRTMTLAQLGIVIDSNKAVQTYAEGLLKQKQIQEGVTYSTEEYNLRLQTMTKYMSEADKKLALQAVIMDEVRKKSASLPAPTEDYADKMQNLSARFEEMKISVGTAILPLFENLANIFLNNLMPAIQPLIPVFTELVKQVAEGLVPILPRLVDFIVRLFEVVQPLIAPLMDLAFIIFNALLDILEPLLPAIEAIVPPIADLLVALTPIIPVVAQIIALLAHMISAVLKNLGPSITAVLPAIELLIKFLTTGIEVITKLVDWVKTLVEWIAKINLGIIEKAGSLIGGGVSAVKKVLKVNDAVITPNGQVIQTHPDDYLIATKNPTGTNITINIESVQGLDPDAIAEALQSKLKNVISI